MTYAVRTRILTFCLAVLPAGPAFTQAQLSEASTAATASTANVAYVYVGTAKGVNLYDAASNGKLTLVSGSPFKIAGTAAGSNGKFFLTLGTQYLHSYPVAANGSLKAQVSQINTANYAGGDCEAPSSASLDLTGQNVYVLMSPSAGDGSCTAYQSYSLGKTNGALAFQTVAIVATDSSTMFPLTFTANNQFAFAANPDGGAGIVLLSYQVFSRQSNGALELSKTIRDVFLQDTPDGANYFPWLVNAGPGSYLAAALGDYLYYQSPIESIGPTVLASYTVDANGNISTTNPGAEAPSPAVGPTMMKMSPSGNLLAVAGGKALIAPISVSIAGNGLQIFHFNGPNPITPYSKVLTSDSIDQMQWDNNDHLFALSDSTDKLYVYTVTPTSITAAPGSPYTIAGANALVVVPASSCSAPSSDGVHICSPASGSSVRSPVLVEATSKVAGTIVSTQLWVDGVKNSNAPGSTTLTTSVSLAAGTHRFAVIATNTSGQKWESTVNATVK
jgi:hypothetical protein